MVYSVDIDPNMIDKARKNVANFKNVIVIQSNLISVDLLSKVNVIFSNAALHWVSDHKKVFRY
jgi:trans-aconitate methyltransferase